MEAATASDRSYPEGLAVRATLTRLIATTRYAERITGTALIEAYDAEAGRRAERALEDSLAAQIAAVATPAAVAAARSRVPSAKASRFPVGMRSPKARTAVRSGRTERWEVDRLLALVAGLGYAAEVRLVKVAPAEV